MYWPPQWTPNNQVTVSDDKYVSVLSLPPRFASFTSAATILSPWIARSDQDTVWRPGDPMLRALLFTGVSDPLYSLNNSGQGSIVALGSPPVGTQAWEVVSSFDYYETSDVNLKGVMLWGRLWEGYVPPPVPVSILAAYNTNGVLDHDGFSSSVSILPSGYIVLAFACDDMLVIPTSVTVDGQPLSMIVDYTGTLSSTRMNVWAGNYVTTGGPAVVAMTWVGTPSWGYILAVLSGWTSFAGQPTATGQYAGGPPSLTMGGPTVMTVSLGIAFELESYIAGPMPSQFDSPWVYDSAMAFIWTSGPVNYATYLAFQPYATFSVVSATMSSHSSVDYAMVLGAAW